MNCSHRPLIALLAVTAFALPGLAQATSGRHLIETERGTLLDPHPPSSSKTRAQVMDELAAARKDGTLAAMARGLPIPSKTAPVPKTREKVKEEARQYFQEKGNRRGNDDRS